jgi:hypothetical protein
VCDSGGAAPSILHVEAQPAAAQVIPWRWPPLVATQWWQAWIWAWRCPPSSTATTTAGVSAGPRSGPDGPRSELDCFFYFQNSIFCVGRQRRYYKPFIFCIVQIVSVARADTKYRFRTDIINTFCCSGIYTCNISVKKEHVHVTWQLTQLNLWCSKSVKNVSFFC